MTEADRRMASFSGVERAASDFVKEQSRSIIDEHKDELSELARAHTRKLLSEDGKRVLGEFVKAELESEFRRLIRDEMLTVLTEWRGK